MTGYIFSHQLNLHVLNEEYARLIGETKEEIDLAVGGTIKESKADIYANELGIRFGVLLKLNPNMSPGKILVDSLYADDEAKITKA